MDPETLRHSELILLWGTNTLTTNMRLWRNIQEARITGLSQAISILNGLDACTPAAIAAGVNGWFAGSCSVTPKQCVELFDPGAKKKDMDAMRAYFEPMFPIADFMGVKGYIRVAHAACEILGHPMGPNRMPLRPLGKADHDHLKGLLSNLMRSAKN
jgi:dihydrodipicolinate synthase/N-acetylneuraminate lyase